MIEDPCIPLSSLILIGAWIVMLFVAYIMIFVSVRRWENQSGEDNSNG